MTDATNPFEAFADASRSPRAKAFLDKPPRASKAAMAPTPAQKREREARDLSRAYRRYKTEQLRELLAGPHGRNIVELRKFMRRLTMGDAPALLAHLASLIWLAELSVERRQLVCALISGQIVRIRARAGLHPYDDPLPANMSEGGEEEPSAAIIVLQMLAA
jgi:hypothetical protein